MQILWQMFPILILHAIREGSACSAFCACRWKNGKQTVECGNKNLSEIPDGLDPETQVLDFAGNKLNKLHKDFFLKKQLTNLQRVYLADCKIKIVHRDTFKGLTNLVELDLSNNLLESVPSGAFMNCLSLMKLTLNANPLTSIKKLAFNHLSYLNTLELSNCRIFDIEEDAFQGLHRLEWLYLDGNHLETIRGRRTLPETVKGVELQKNAWECDCNMLDLSAWLRDFKSLLSAEPVCQGPARLTGRVIKLIPPSELACLPNVSPTSFYLELGEGKNVSLICHVQAIPEATVSWWFQGRMLQNDTMVAPGVHLIYFIEEGAENKRSELFIYNANADDNGTFICNADNAAGTSQSNYTIKIILKENPIVIIVSFPLEYFLLAIIGISVLGILVLIIVTVVIIKCHRKNRRQKKLNETKKVAMQYQQNANKLSGDVKCLSDTIKMNTPSVSRQDHIMAYSVQPCKTIGSSALSPIRNANQVRSPASLRRFQLEQNPDIINGTEGIPRCRREGDGEDDKNQEHYQKELVNPAQFPIACLRENTEFFDNGRCIVDHEGYPVDYGLPKMPCRTQYGEGYYRTLPSNRMKRHTAANPYRRFSREAEFLSRSVDSPYENQIDVRYTADGYPARVPSQEHSHPLESFPNASLPYCSVQWPRCVPANLHVLNQTLNPKVSYQNQSQCLSKRSASAQTDTESDCEYPERLQPVNKSETTAVSGQNDAVNEILTESPDEGYEGEPSVV